MLIDEINQKPVQSIHPEMKTFTFSQVFIFTLVGIAAIIK